MARIFSIYFTHEGVEQNALISVRTTPFFVEYAVAIFNEPLAAQLPNNKIISTAKGSFVFSDSAKENAPALMQQIIQAVAQHLQTIDA